NQECKRLSNCTPESSKRPRTQIVQRCHKQYVDYSKNDNLPLPFFSH
ncbi:19105_t:CDS:1, partial [Racocetra persica]